MNQFRRTVADENHVRIHATMLRQRLFELPTIGIWIVHDLLERQADRSEHRCGRTQRVDAGAEITIRSMEIPCSRATLYTFPP